MKIPSAWNEEAKATPVAASTQVTARIDMGADTVDAGLCPDCRQPMERAFIGDTEVLTCLGCRITLPIKNA